jgi:gliding motility-associated-like protein
MSGVYTKTELDKNGCDSTTTLTLTVVPLPTLATESVIKMKQGETQFLNVKVQSKEIYNIDWQPNTYLNKSDTTVVVCAPSESIKYKVVVTTASTCQSETTIFIEVSRGNHVYIPTAFSPNDDGINDAWQVFSDDPNLDIMSVRVYNRLGGLVHDSSAPWFAENAVSDVYTYVISIKINGKTEIYKGDVMVVR